MVRLDPQFRYHWADGSTLTVADDNDSTAAAFEEFAAGRRRAVALVRCAGPADLGRGRAHVLRRSDDEPGVAGATLAVAVRRPRDRSVPHAAPLGPVVLRRRPARAVGRPVCHLFGLVAVPRAGHAGLHPPHRGALRVLVPVGRAGRDPRRARTARPRRAAWRSAPAPRPRASRPTRGRRPRRRPRRRHRTRRRRGGGQRRCRAPLHRPGARCHRGAAGAPGRAFDERVRDLRRRARPDAGPGAPQRVVRRRRARRVRRDPAAASCPTTRRSTRASRRSPTPRRRPTGARTGSCSSTPRRARRSTGSEASNSCWPLGATRRSAPRADRVRPHDDTEPTSPRATGRRAGRSTARRRTGCAPRSCRPANRGTRAGLYLVGGSSHPGGGLPLVLTSARIVADMIEDDRRSESMTAARRIGRCTWFAARVIAAGVVSASLARDGRGRRYRCARR